MAEKRSIIGLNFVLGASLDFAGTGYINGKSVTSPVTLDKAGYFWFENSLRILEFAVIDPLDDVIYRLCGVGGSGNPYFLRMLRRSILVPLNSIPKSPNSLKRFELYANKPVGLTLYLKVGGVFKAVSKVMVRESGPASGYANFPTNQQIIDAKLEVVYASSPYDVDNSGYEGWGEGEWGFLPLTV